MKKESLAERIYKEVKESMTNGEFSPDSYIVEKDICRTYAVSKATAGEVLHRLTQEGLLKSYPRKGYKLKVYSEQDFMKLQQLRFAIESLMLHRIVTEVEPKAIKNAFGGLPMENMEFHLGLAALVKDQFITGTLENLLARAANTYDRIDFEDGSDAIIRRRHQRIVDALADKNEAEAIDALRADLRLDHEEDPLGDLGTWKRKRSFTVKDMEQLACLCDPQITRDGKWIAVTQYKPDVRDGRFYPSILLYDSRKSEPEVLEGKGFRKNPRFSRKGEYLAYLSDQSGEFQIYCMDKEGKETKITSLRHGVKAFEISPDGRSFIMEADLWSEEIACNTAFLEMDDRQKQGWLHEREWAPVEITEIDYKRDECKGVRDGSISCIVLADCEGRQRLLTGKFPCHMPVFGADDTHVAFYGMPYTGPFYSAQELFVMDIHTGEMRQLTSERNLPADCPPAFTESGKEIIYPAYYMEKGTSIQYLYKVSLDGKEQVCLFDKDASEICSGVFGVPGCRTEYGENKPYFQVKGDEVYFLCAWQGAERLYKISTRGNSKPKLVLEGEYSIHEFCLPVKDKLLLAKSDHYTPKELVLLSLDTGKAVTVANPNSWLYECSLGKVIELRVRSADDKVWIQGWVCKPADFIQGKKYPAVLYLHGGPDICYTNDFWHEIQILANAGYAVVYCNPRGSTGYGREFSDEEAAWGEEAYQDMMCFLDEAVSMGFIDENKVGITGGSYGGYMTCKILMKTDRFAAAVGQRIFVNKATSYGTGDIGFYSAAMDYREVNIKECLMQRARTSIIKDMDRITTPLLLLHGYQDYRCSFEQAEQMFIAMKERRPEVPVKLVMFPGENHEVSRGGLLHFRQRHVREMTDWFDTYLKGEGNEQAK